MSTLSHTENSSAFFPLWIFSCFCRDDGLFFFSSTPPLPGQASKSNFPSATSAPSLPPPLGQATSIALTSRHAVPGFQLNPVMQGDATVRGDQPVHQLVMGVLGE